MSEEYLDDGQREELKSKLYEYLSDKAQRKALTGSSKSYEAMQKKFSDQEQLHDVGALAGAFSEAASMAGTIQGKRAQSNIIPKMNEDLYNSTEGSFKNLQSMRQDERANNAEDLHVAQYLQGIGQHDDANNLAQERLAMDKEDHASKQELLRRQLAEKARAKYKLAPQIKGAGGAPVMLDDYGNPKTLEGFGFNEKALAQHHGDEGNWVEAPGESSEPGMIVQRNTKTGEYRKKELPPNFTPAKKPGPKEKQLSPHDVVNVGLGRDAQNAMSTVKNSLDKWRGLMGPIEGRYHENNPWNTDAQKFNSDLKLAAQKIGKYLEGGVLRKEDEIKYERMLPTLHDTPAVADYKLQQVFQSLKDKQDADLGALQAQGYKTPGLEGKPLPGTGGGAPSMKGLTEEQLHEILK